MSLSEVEPEIESPCIGLSDIYRLCEISLIYDFFHFKASCDSQKGHKSKFSAYVLFYTSRDFIWPNSELNRIETYFATAEQLLSLGNRFSLLRHIYYLYWREQELYWSDESRSKTHIRPTPQGIPPSHTKAYPRPLTPWIHLISVLWEYLLLKVL